MAQDYVALDTLPSTELLDIYFKMFEIGMFGGDPKISRQEASEIAAKCQEQLKRFDDQRFAMLEENDNLRAYIEYLQIRLVKSSWGFLDYKQWKEQH